MLCVWGSGGPGVFSTGHAVPRREVCGALSSQELGSLATLYPLLPSCQDLCLSNLSLSPVAELPCREIGKAAEGSDVRAVWSKWGLGRCVVALPGGQTWSPQPLRNHITECRVWPAESFLYYWGLVSSVWRSLNLTHSGHFLPGIPGVNLTENRCSTTLGKSGTPSGPSVLLCELQVIVPSSLHCPDGSAQSQVLIKLLDKL